MDPKHKGRTYVMELPEVGSKWVAKVDNPRSADIKKGDVVEVTGADKALVGYTGGWCCVTEKWTENFEPYTEEKREFQVGDKVKCLHPVIVCDGFKGQVGEVIGFSTFEGVALTILYPCGTTQLAFVEDDGVVLVESAQTKKAPTELTAEGYTPKDFVDLLSMSEDNVNSPSHYGQGEIEAIVYIKDFLTKEEYIGYLRGNIAKYLHRWRYKNGVEDLEKAQVYLGWLITEIGETK